MIRQGDTHIGDGVYVRYREGIDDVAIMTDGNAAIYLDRSVLEQLIAFCKRVGLILGKEN